MKTKYYVIFAIIFVISGLLLTFKWLTYPKFNSYEREITKQYPNESTSYPEDYDSLCKLEFQKGVTFPKTKPSYSLLHFDKFLKPNIRLTNRQMVEILESLNDTANYTWGELGTPYFDRFITFHDQKGNCVGLTKIDLGGQSYSTPYIAKMKWGLIKAENYRINELITEIEKN
jgi:hypothetical protein